VSAWVLDALNRDNTRYMSRATFIEKLTSVQRTVEELLAQLQASEHDKFAAHLYQASREYRLVCERPGKGTKQIERCIISTFQIAESLGFNGELRQREHLLRGNINRLSLRFFVGVEKCFPGPICNSS
jgi:hypothetical protein